VAAFDGVRNLLTLQNTREHNT